MLNPILDTGIDSILNLNTESTSLVDVPVTTNDDIPPSSVTTLPLPHIPLIQPLQQTLVSTLTIDLTKTSHAVAANLSELELKKILIDKMEINKLIDRLVQQKTLYKALVDAYETDKDILATYKDTVMFKRRRDDEDEEEEPSTGSNRGSKRRRSGKESDSSSAPKEKTSKSTDNTLARKEDPHESFNELIDSPIDFSAFVLNWLKVDTLTPELLVGPTFELMKGSYKSLVKLEYFLEEVYKATTDQLD
ncbi:hypothetical protein Tco_0319505 [Tanacetum coccineum]